MKNLLLMLALLFSLPLGAQILTDWTPATGSEWQAECPAGPAASLMHVESSVYLFEDTRLARGVNGSLAPGEFDLVYGTAAGGDPEIPSGGFQSATGDTDPLILLFNLKDGSSRKIICWAPNRTTTVPGVTFAGAAMTSIDDLANQIRGTLWRYDVSDAVEPGNKTVSADLAAARASGLFCWQVDNAAIGAVAAPTEPEAVAGLPDVQTISQTFTIENNSMVLTGVAARATAAPPILSMDLDMSDATKDDEDNPSGSSGPVQVAGGHKFFATGGEKTFEWDNSFQADDLVMFTVAILTSGTGSSTGCTAYVRLPGGGDPNNETIFLGGEADCCAPRSGNPMAYDALVACIHALPHRPPSGPFNRDSRAGDPYEYWVCPYYDSLYLSIHGHAPWGRRPVQ